MKPQPSVEATAVPGGRSAPTLSQGGYGPFRNLAQLKAGDEAMVYVGEKAYRCIVETVRVVAPEDIGVILPTSSPKLALITCANPDNAKRLNNDRIVALGHLVQQPGMLVNSWQQTSPPYLLPLTGPGPVCFPTLRLMIQDIQKKRNRPLDQR